MVTCKNCGVELEPDMEICPLCRQPVKPGTTTSGVKGETRPLSKPADFEARTMSSSQRKAVWELVSIILILLVIVTSLLNYLINKTISWSEYPVAICLVIFSYVSSFSYVNKARKVQLLLAFVMASLLILTLDYFTGGRNWALQLGIPLLFSGNVIFVGLMSLIGIAKYRGVNLIAYWFLAAALLSLFVEAIVDRYMDNNISLLWSLIAAACIIPVATVLLFMHFRMKKNRDLNKTFHI